MKVTVTVPFGIGAVEWTRARAQQEAAWALYVELVTRVAIQGRSAESGLVREALDSLHSLFPTTRHILREAGPAVGTSERTVGGIALAVLNRGLRPFLSKWHPAYSEWERSAPSRSEAWGEEPGFRRELVALQAELAKYAEALEKIARAKSWLGFLKGLIRGRETA